MASEASQRLSILDAPPTKPRTAWRWSQQWRDVLFLHWPVDEETLRKQLPPGLDVDTYEGQAWVSLVGFRLQGVSFHGWPALPLCSKTLELNYRTYVRYHDEPAIYFLTMHANHRWMIAAAKWLTPLPYEFAKLRYEDEGCAETFVCQPYSTAPPLSAQFRVGEPIGQASSNTLDAWLLDRYVAYAGQNGGLLRMEVQHKPWQLRAIELQQCQQQVTAGGQPVCHYSDGVSSLLSTFESVG